MAGKGRAAGGNSGGARPGSGRKPGTINRRTREAQAKAEAIGVTPLDVMLLAMSEFLAEAQKATTAEAKLAMLTEASAQAQAAAPYIHAKPAATQINVNLDGERFVVFGEHEAESAEEWAQQSARLQ